MKILINLGRFNGGAPLSILEYGKIAKKNGHDVIAVGEYKSVENKYWDANIKTYNVPFFATHKLLTNFKSLILLSKLIKEERPDLIHATSYGIIPSKYLGLFYGIPVIYSIAGGQITGKTHFEGDKLIVYSQENKDDLLSEGYEEDQIQVISNRLSLDNIEDADLCIYDSPEELKLLLISRLDLGVIKSVSNIIDIVDKFAYEHDKLTLDIIGDGEFKYKITEMANFVNDNHKRCIVKVHGFVDKPIMFIKESHIVFGKGRSIIEAVLNDRISFVIGEDKKISLCTVDTLNNLYKYNFSGRNISNASTIKEVNDIITEVKNCRYDNRKLKEISNRVDKLYNIKYAESKIVKMYENTDLKRTKGTISNRFSALLFLMKYYLYELINVKKWNKKTNVINLKV